VVPAARPASNGGFIVSPGFDYLFFILAPAWAAALGVVLFDIPAMKATVRLPWLNPNYAQPLALMLVSVFIHAHLALVFFRSHGNRKIYALHPIRFRVAPVVLLVALLSSQWIFICVTILAIWWDVYHSSLQTFGLGRIYDARAGNDPTAGRRADYLLNLALYAGPILAGINLVQHLQEFRQFDQVDAKGLAQLGHLILSHHGSIRVAVLAIGLPTLLGWAIHTWRLSRRGYRMPRQKALLLGTTGLVSILTWGFLPPGPAFFIMNFFHAFQYFGIVWWSENKTIAELFHTRDRPVLAAVWMIALPLAYGLWAAVQPGMGTGVLAVTIVVSIMHFWYDGFIWSVRKKQV
jgi:hypothetical protein